MATAPKGGVTPFGILLGVVTFISAVIGLWANIKIVKSKKL